MPNSNFRSTSRQRPFNGPPWTRMMGRLPRTTPIRILDDSLSLSPSLNGQTKMARNLFRNIPSCPPTVLSANSHPEHQRKLPHPCATTAPSPKPTLRTLSVESTGSWSRIERRPPHAALWFGSKYSQSRSSAGTTPARCGQVAEW